MYSAIRVLPPHSLNLNNQLQKLNSPCCCCCCCCCCCSGVRARVLLWLVVVVVCAARLLSFVGAALSVAAVFAAAAAAAAAVGQVCFEAFACVCSLPVLRSYGWFPRILCCDSAWQSLARAPLFDLLLPSRPLLLFAAFAVPVGVRGALVGHLVAEKNTHVLLYSGCVPCSARNG